MRGRQASRQAGRTRKDPRRTTRQATEERKRRSKQARKQESEKAIKEGAPPGIEPGTSRTQSENHTTRPRGRYPTAHKHHKHTTSNHSQNTTHKHHKHTSTAHTQPSTTTQSPQDRTPLPHSLLVSLQQYDRRRGKRHVPHRPSRKRAKHKQRETKRKSDQIQTADEG